MSEKRKQQLAKMAKTTGRNTAKAIEWVFRNNFAVGFALGLLMMLVSPIIGYAQGPPPGPITYNGYSDTAPLKAGQAVIRILMWFMFIVGIGLWCMVPIMGPRKGNWFTYAAFGTVALGIGGWIALSHRVGGGDTPELPDILGR